MQSSSALIPAAFIWRRVHSLAGLGLVVFLFEHLIVNSQAAIWMGGGHRFVYLVNRLHCIPCLHAVEISLIGFPLLVHMVWGCQRIFTAKANSLPSGGASPALQEYPRNHAYTWQRITSWILLIGIIAHVVQMRFLDYPKIAESDEGRKWIVSLTADERLPILAAQFGVELVSAETIAKMDCREDSSLDRALREMRLKKGELAAVSSTSGAAILLKVRDTFKSPWMAAAYTLFVLAAAFHAMNGFWTFLIAWGAILSMRSQITMSWVSYAGMALLVLLGCMAIWGGN